MRRDLGGARRALLDRLTRYAEARGHEIVVVFDAGESVGLPWSPGGGGGVQVLYSRTGERADDVLMAAARERGAGAVVVSSDREVADAVRRAGGVAVRSEAFERRVGRALAGLPAEGEGTPREKGRGPSRRPSDEERRVRRILEKL